MSERKYDTTFAWIALSLCQAQIKLRKVYDTYRGQNALSERHTLAIIARLEEELGRLCVPVSVGLGSKDLWVVISIMVFYNDNASIKYDRRTI